MFINFNQIIKNAKYYVYYSKPNHNNVFMGEFYGYQLIDAICHKEVIPTRFPEIIDYNITKVCKNCGKKFKIHNNVTKENIPYVFYCKECQDLSD
jgi:hypothetical protein